MNKVSLRYLITILLLTICVQLSAQTEQAEARLEAIIKQYDVVGLSVAVVKDGKISYTHSFGLKDIASNTPLTDQNMFRIASISKSFSATSIMQLIEAGKLSLNDDFSNLVGFKVRNPKFPETIITLKMVMSHTSSVNDSRGYFNLDSINPAKSANWAKCYNNYEPGKGYQYCNLNFNMVGAVIEKFSGERFDQYVKHHILDPLGLYGGYCVDSLDKSRFATLYEYDSTTKRFTPAPAAYNPRSEEIRNHIPTQTTPVFSPTGGMKISATDLAKYMIMHMNQGKSNGRRIISKKSAKLMQTKISDDEGYGLAIRTVTDLVPGKVMTGHTGSAYGLYSGMFFQKEEKSGVVVITNGCNPVYSGGYCDVIKKSINALYETLLK